MDKPLPSIARITFIVHLIVAIVFGVGLLVIPDTFNRWGGFSAAPADYISVLRCFGACILGLGGVTSMYGAMAKSWAKVDYIVRAEISYLAIQTVVWLIAGIMGDAPALGIWLNAAVSIVLLALFVWTWFARPK